MITTNEVKDLVLKFTDDRATLDFLCAVAAAAETLVKAAVAEERERGEYNRHVLAKIWSIVKENEESEYDTNNLYDRLRELVGDKLYSDAPDPEFPFVVSREALCVGRYICHERGPNRPNKIARFDSKEEALEVARRMNRCIRNERERCAGIAEHAFDHNNPLAIYEVYNADGKKVTRLNTEASARAVANKIRSGE